ncbi:MAG: hypothetical protein ACKVP2_07550 [Burkholderiales bacterium]
MKSTLRNAVFPALLAATLAAAAPQAAAQGDRAKVGDLVEFTSGLGPTLAEIVEGPDPSGYVVIAVPTGKRLPVNTQKLRLIQKAGTPNAPMPVGEAVRWTDGGVMEKGNVVKVNGNWCQVKTPSATTVGWVECKALRTTAQAAVPATESRPAKTAATAKPVAVKLQGNWENADGTVKLEFQASKKCYLSLGPMTSPCTYKQSDSGVTVTFAGEDMVLAVNEDGSLSSADPDAMMPIRLKRK